MSGAPVAFELFAVGPSPPDAVWSIVGDPRRLPEWTDADAVEADAEPRVGGRFVTVDGGRRLEWRVETLERFLLEARTQTARGRLGLGVRVARDPLGCRVILAGVLEPVGSRLRAQLWDVPSLKKRFDRWSHAALRAARS